MDDRYKKFAAEGVRELTGYNKAYSKANGDDEDCVMPQVVIIIDELADLMMAAPSQVEESICRLAQKARAAGMHLIVATQRPSVDVITGVIKANIPSRIAFAVSSQFDSRTILDMSGSREARGKRRYAVSIRWEAANLSGYREHSSPTRKSQNVIDFVRDQVEDSGVFRERDGYDRTRQYGAEPRRHDRDLEDELLPDAIELVVEARQASVSMLQRQVQDRIQPRGEDNRYDGRQADNRTVRRQQAETGTDI